ncbi:MAG TPA: DUF4350 domain-containing protein [Methanoregula sp.]|nr:DUF4350 domain-containing protein [Methanoregula sp.]
MEFSRYNIGWNGTSEFFSDLDRHRTIEIGNPEQLSGYHGNTTLLILAPHRHPTVEELGAYNAFLREGNTIFLTDDFGTGNEILKGINSRISIRHENLSSLDRRYADIYSVIVYRSDEKSTVPLPSQMALNGAGPVEGGTPVMLTSVMSWADSNRDRRLNMNEEMGTIPVMAEETVGSGRLIVFSDPSIFTNTMYSQPENADNRAFIGNLTAGEQPVLVDQMNSLTAGAEGLSGIIHVIRKTVFIEVVILSLLMLCIAWAWKKKDR